MPALPSRPSTTTARRCVASCTDRTPQRFCEAFTPAASANRGQLLCRSQASPGCTTSPTIVDAVGEPDLIQQPRLSRGTEGLQTLRWRERIRTFGPPRTGADFYSDVCSESCRRKWDQRFDPLCSSETE